MKRCAIIYAAIIGCLSAPASAVELAVVGTGDGTEMLQAVAAVFNTDHPDLTVSIPPSIGSGGAVAAVAADRNKLGRVARPLTESEKAQGLVEVPVVRIPSAFFVHADAGVKALTADQLVAIFEGRIENWNDVGGADVKIKVVRREETDSTLTVLRATMPGWKTIALTPKSKSAVTTQEALETVKRVPGSIGFGPYSPSIEDGAVVLAIDGKRPADEAYPSAVGVGLIFKNGALDEPSRNFVAFATSAKARKVLIDGGGVPLTR